MPDFTVETVDAQGQATLSNECMLWADELCASCRQASVTKCTLLRTLRDLRITTLSGLHVASCVQYDPDMESQFYIPPPAVEDIEAVQKAIRDLNRIAQDQRYANARSILEGADVP